MLGTIRKFSTTPLAKVILVIIIIPFIFWGMGPLFKGGTQNIIVEIDNEKISTQEFIDYVRNYGPLKRGIDKKLIEELLSNFISEKIIALDIENFNIKLSDKSLSQIIKNETIFKKDDKFSRTEYEKYLVKYSLTAVTLESNISKQKRKEQLQELIGGGVLPSKFLINDIYDKQNQERIIHLINLNDLFDQKLKFTQDQIENYYMENIDNYKDVYKTVDFVKLDPISLTENDEYTNLFFEKIDEIDDYIADGKSLKSAIKKFNLTFATSYTFNKFGLNNKLTRIEKLPLELINNIFKISNEDPAVIIELKNEYFLIEVNNTENIQRKLNEPIVQKDIFLSLEKNSKKKLMAEIISQINRNEFKKSDFDKFSKSENIPIKKIKINNKSDYEILKKEIINQIYKFSEKQIIVVADINMTESFLVYIDKVNRKFIKENAKDYQKYLNLGKIKLVNSLYNTYDIYIKEKYKVNINYQTFDNIVPSFRELY